MSSCCEAQPPDVLEQSSCVRSKHAKWLLDVVYPVTVGKVHRIGAAADLFLYFYLTLCMRRGVLKNCYLAKCDYY